MGEQQEMPTPEWFLTKWRPILVDRQLEIRRDLEAVLMQSRNLAPAEEIASLRKDVGQRLDSLVTELGRLRMAEEKEEKGRATLLADNRELRKLVGTVAQTQLQMAASMQVIAAHVMRARWWARLLRLPIRFWNWMRRKARA